MFMNSVPERRTFMNNAPEQRYVYEQRSKTALDLSTALQNSVTEQCSVGTEFAATSLLQLTDCHKHISVF